VPESQSRRARARERQRARAREPGSLFGLARSPRREDNSPPREARQAKSSARGTVKISPPREASTSQVLCQRHRQDKSSAGGTGSPPQEAKQQGRITQRSGKRTRHHILTSDPHARFLRITTTSTGRRPPGRRRDSTEGLTDRGYGIARDARSAGEIVREGLGQQLAGKGMLLWATYSTT